MNIVIPPPPNGYNQYSFMQAFDAIRRAFLPLVSKDEATSRILLQSPDGTVYQLTVDNGGSITVAAGSSTISLVKNDGKTRT